MRDNYGNNARNVGPLNAHSRSLLVTRIAPDNLPRSAYINAIATAVPSHDVHDAFIGWAERCLSGARKRALFRRMAGRAGIEHRWSVLAPTAGGGSPVSPGGFYEHGSPLTSERMRIYSEAAPALALAAVRKLTATASPQGITHLVVASCTGFVAPGIDQIIARELGLDLSVERTLIGFMGCYAAISALRTAYHIVRSEPAARVLAVTVELSTLHLQYSDNLEALLGMLQFGDGAAAALVTADPSGFLISRPFALAMPNTDRLIRWTIGDTGFAMQLSGEVPGQIAAALGDASVRNRILGEAEAGDVGSWAVHAGGRSILDSVQRAFALPQHALDASREVLSRYGNMSSSTLMFVLGSLLQRPEHQDGIALAFGPGLAAEGFQFSRAG